MECIAPQDCPGTDDDCQTRACASGLCGMDYEAPGTPVTAQTPGDCQEVQCDGAGGTTSVADTSDLPDDANDCTDDLCDGSTPSYPNLDPDTSCNQNGGQVCDGAGQCVECNDPSQCAATTGGDCVSHVCQAPNCSDHITNGGETDEDCGGATSCDRCDVGSACNDGSDCVTGACGTNDLCEDFAVVATIPADLDTEVSVDATLLVVFNAPADPTTLSAQTYYGACTGSIQVSVDDFATCIAFTSSTPTMQAGDSEAVLTPTTPLQPSATYKIRVTSTAESSTNSALGTQFDTADGFTTAARPVPCGGSVVISQVYGGGGNSGAVYTNDFIELHNRGDSSVSLAGWSVQYASSSGSSWQVTPLTGTIAPGGYYLIQENAGSGGTTPLPTPDDTGSISMGGTSGKVALVASTTALSGASPSTSEYVDLVGYGSSATYYEGTSSTGNLSSTTSAQRLGEGCQDTDDNGADFEVLTTAPRNSATTAVVCACGSAFALNETGLDAEADYCVLQWPYTLDVTSGGTTAVVYGQIYEAGVTEVAGDSGQFVAEVGYGPVNQDPTWVTGWTFFTASWDAQVGNNDEYANTMVAPTQAGSYWYTFRFSSDGGVTWTYCDLDGAGSNTDLSFDPGQLGIMTVY